MNIQDTLIRQGGFLFRWRSFIPFILIAPALAAAANSSAIQNAFGDHVEDVVLFSGFLVSLAGLAIRWATIGFVPQGTSGRNTQNQRAEAVNKTGMYSVVKNPLYLGNSVALLGILLSIKVWWFVVIGVLAYWIYIERVIAAEERFLTEKFGPVYTEWAKRTPIFVPDVRLWQKPEMPFSFKKVLRGEYNGLMAVGTVFFLNNFITDILVQREDVASWLAQDWFWFAEFIVISTIFVVLRTLKKKTKILSVAPEGR